MSNCGCSGRTNVTTELSTEPSRRGFFGKVSAIALAFVAWPKLAFAGKKWVALPLDKAPKLQKVGGSMVTRIRGKDLLLVRDAEGSAHAFEAKCPHEFCDLKYDPDDKKIDCPCHQAVFDLSGKVLEGPPPRPLETYQAIVDGERILLNIPN